MRVLIQRVKMAKVMVEEKVAASIGQGLLLLVGVAKDDEEKDVKFLAQKIVQLRIFEDEQKKMNLNILQVKGQILSVPQFTLYADTTKGHRPGFDKAAEPKKAIELWQKFDQSLKDLDVFVAEGVFGAHMEVELVNDGPVTLGLDSKSGDKDSLKQQPIE